MNEILGSLHDDRLTTLLDYAEYLLRRQEEEDAADVTDSMSALKESGSIAWEKVKLEIDAHVRD